MNRATSVAALCMVTFLQAYLLVSVFPYAAYMAVLLWNSEEDVQHAHPMRRLSTEDKITVEDAGPYAALLATSFMLGRTFAALIWGKLADVYGRKWVLLVSLFGSGFASLWFGVSTTYSNAVLSRGAIGAWNSVVGVSKTLATELAYHDFGSECRIGCETNEPCNSTTSSAHQGTEQTSKEQLETRIVGLSTSMRAWGFLIAPAIAGLLADPLGCRTGCDYAAEEHIGVAGLFNNILETYPYLLPNLLGAVISWSAALAVYLGMPETLPGSRSSYLLGRDLYHWIAEHWRNIFSTKAQAQTHNHVLYGSLEDNSNGGEDEQCQPTTLSVIWSRRSTRYHLWAYWLYSLIIIAIDEAFPLYCVSHNNGLHGLSEAEIGKILSLSGLIFSVLQYKVYSSIVERWGVHTSLSIGCWLGIFPVAAIPFGSLFSPMLYLSVLMGTTKVFQSMFFSSITIATNRTVPSNMRSSMNGFGGMGAGIAKAIGPMVAGLWMANWLSKTSNVEERVPIHSLAAFGGIASLGLVILALLPLLNRNA